MRSARLFPVPGLVSLGLVLILLPSAQAVPRSFFPGFGFPGPFNAVAMGFSRINFTNNFLVPGLTNALHSPNGNVQMEALSMLGRLGPAASGAAPTIQGILGSSNNSAVVLQATRSLYHITGNPGQIIPTLQGALRSPNSSVQMEALSMLGRLGPSASGATPVIQSLLGSSNNSTVVLQATRSLYHINGNASQIIPTLQGALRSPNATVQIEALGILGRVGPAASAAAPSVSGLLNNGNNYVALKAARSLFQINGNAGEVIPTIIGGLQSPIAQVRMTALGTLGSLGGSATSASGALQQAMTQGDPMNRARVALTLGQANGLSGPALFGLVIAAAGNNPTASSTAATTLSNLTLNNLSSARSLSQCGPFTNSPLLQSMSPYGYGLGYGGFNPYLLSGYGAGLQAYPGMFYPPYPYYPTVPSQGQVSAGLNSPGNQAAPNFAPPQSGSSTGVQNANPPAPARADNSPLSSPEGQKQLQVANLLKGLEDESPAARWHAVVAVGRLGADARSAVPSLVPLLKDEDAALRWAAARALGDIGPAAQEGVSALQLTLSDSDGNVREAATKALRQIRSEKPKDKAKGVGDVSVQRMD